MRILGTDIYAQRNETVGIDFTIQNPDGTPYIVSSELVNPYILFTIGSANFKQTNRYVKNYWLDLANYPRFYSTTPFDLNALMTSANGTTPAYNELPAVTDTISGYIGADFYSFTPSEIPDESVYKWKDSQGVRYIYAKSNTSNNETTYGWDNYSFRIIRAFTQNDMSNMVEQSYVYSIVLVSGEKMTSYLQGLCYANDIDYDEKTNEQMYNELKAAGQTFAPGFDYEWIIGKFNVYSPIVAKSKFVISSAINGGM